VLFEGCSSAHASVGTGSVFQGRAGEWFRLRAGQLQGSLQASNVKQKQHELSGYSPKGIVLP